ncbi:MAG: selenocysteine-specific translation elongation factor [Polyangiaceae bacterium]|nr:selenocysteine-specific translation elongation factor [Polyangiaceae bacterium]
MRRFVIGTAGHVDHGKTTLVQALTGIDTDRLPEEKRRGITIELGFAPWDLGDSVQVSVIDVPGHRRLVHTMIAGASGIELVLLVVAADEGVMPQTREHIAACELLGLRRAVVAITKVDRSGEELAQLAAEEALELLGDHWKASSVLVSARTGQGLDALREAVKKALREIEAQDEERAAAPRLSVDRAFSVKGSGTVVTGTLVGGSVSIGTPLRLVGPSNAVCTTARGLHVHDRAVTEAVAPTRLAVNLAGVALESVNRGDVLTSDEHVAASNVVDAAFFPARGAVKKRPLKRGTIASMYVGTARATAKANPLRDGDLSAGDGPMFVRLRLAHPLVLTGGDRYVLRGADSSGPAGAVLGGGVVLDAYAPRARLKEKRARVLSALYEGNAKEAIVALVTEASPRPFLPNSLSCRFKIGESALTRAADKLVTEGTVVRLKNGGLCLRSKLIDMALRARSLVLDHHRQAPLDRGLPLETLRRKIAFGSSPEAADEAIRLAARKGTLQPKSPPAPAKSSTKAMPAPDDVGPEADEPIAVEGDIARFISMERATDASASGPLGKALRAMEETGLRGLSEATMREATGAEIKEVKAILAKLVREGIAVTAGDLWFSKPAVTALKEKIAAHLRGQPVLTIADLKTISGLGRRQVIPLLELFDREGFTKRQGDDRVAGSAFPKA